MPNQSIFNLETKSKFKTLDQYVPVVARVHGASHPEFLEVRKVYDHIIEKMKASGDKKANLNEEFAQLREITNHYKVPGEVCESYEAVYHMLAEVDELYQV